MQLLQLGCIGTLSLLRGVLVTALSIHQTLSSQILNIDDRLSSDNRTKVPAQSPAYHCSSPSDDVFKIRRLDFIPTNPRMQVLQNPRSAALGPSSNLNHPVATP